MTKACEPALYYFQNGPARGFVLPEESLVWALDTQLPGGVFGMAPL